MLSQNAFLIGIIIGFASSVISAVVDYRIMQRRADREESSGPGCMFIVSGTLGWLGIVVVGASLFLHSLNRALLAGLGVLVGFLAGFLLMLALWFLLQRTSSET